MWLLTFFFITYELRLKTISDMDIINKLKKYRTHMIENINWILKIFKLWIIKSKKIIKSVWQK